MQFIKEFEHSNNIGIYAIHNKINDYVYVGKTEDRFVERYWHHVWTLNHNSHSNEHLNRAWNKYGEDNFIFYALHVDDGSGDLNELEKLYISKYKKNGNSYNISIGGDGRTGVPMSEHAKKIVGEKNKIHGIGRKASDATKQRMSNSSQHKSPTEEHKAKLREWHVGKIVKEETKQKLSILYSGDKNKFAKIDNTCALRIKELLMEGNAVIDVSKRLAVAYQTVSNINADRNWKSIKIDGWDEYIKNKCVARQSCAKPQ